jgi:hypothetical protein
VEGAPGRTTLQTVHALLAAHRAHDWDGLRSLFHPRARIGVFAAGGRPEEPEEAIAAMRRAAGDIYYTARVSEITELDAGVVLLEGRVSYRDGTSVVDVERTWLYVIEDGLLYRSQVFRSRSDARNAYATFSRTLGVPDSQPSGARTSESS